MRNIGTPRPIAARCLLVAATLACATWLGSAASGCASFLEKMEQPRIDRCGTHLQETWKALGIYAETHAGYYPYFPGDTALDELQVLLDLGQLEDGETLLCPSSRETPADRRGDGTWNLLPRNLSFRGLDRQLSREDTDKPLMWDSQPRHLGRANVLFPDGRVELLTPEELQAARRAGTPGTAPPPGDDEEAPEPPLGVAVEVASGTAEAATPGADADSPYAAADRMVRALQANDEAAWRTTVTPGVADAWQERYGGFDALRTQVLQAWKGASPGDRIEYEDSGETRALILVRIGDQPHWLRMTRDEDGVWLWADLWE